MESTIGSNGIRGFKKCPNWLRNAYRKAVDYICPRCKRHESICGKLQIHRKIRGCQGGLYTVLPINHPDNNCDIDCNSCHKKLHSNEFKSKSK